MEDQKNRIYRIFKQLGFENNISMVKATGGQRNQVWICGNYVIRMNFQINSQNLHNEALVLNKIPDTIPHPKVIAVGYDDDCEWQIQNKLGGHPLTQVWASMPRHLRKQAIQQLAKHIKGIHALEPSKFKTSNLSNSYLQSELPDKIIDLAMQSKAFPYVDSALMEQVIIITKRMSNEISSKGRWSIIHNDFHFDNVLWDGQNITALIDYEKACYAPIDLELDMLLRFCAYPALYVHEEYEYLVHPEDYKMVSSWFYEIYPEIFMVDKLTERLSLYSLLYDLQLLQKYPPKEKVNPDENDHLINRIRAVAEQRSYLSTLTKMIHQSD